MSQNFVFLETLLGLKFHWYHEELVLLNESAQKSLFPNFRLFSTFWSRKIIARDSHSCTQTKRLR